MKSPRELVKKLFTDDLFKRWDNEHPQNFLSHFFVALNYNFVPKVDWEIGLFDPVDNKITVFVPLEDGFEIKPADDVFKKKESKVEKLLLDDIKITFETALNTFKENLPEFFPNEQLGDGFVILQTFQEKTIWNFTFVTKSLKFVNLKIDAVDGGVAEHQTVDLVNRE